MLRNEIIDFLIAEVVGPDKFTYFKQKNDEEILVHYSPKNRYGAGVLFPQSNESIEDVSLDSDEEKFLKESDDNPNDNPKDKVEYSKSTGYTGSSEEDRGKNDDVVKLANALKPSALGITCCVNPDHVDLNVQIDYAVYQLQEFICPNCKGSGLDSDGHKKCTKCLAKKKGYHRIPTTKTEIVSIGDIGGNSEFATFIVDGNSENEGLQLRINKRSTIEAGVLYTFSLINLNHAGSYIKNEDCYYQVKLRISGKNESDTFMPVSPGDVVFDHIDGMVNDLIYRKKQNYALGHGCSVEWNDGPQKFNIESTPLPIAEVKNISSNPGRFSKVNLSIQDFAADDNSGSLSELKKIEALYLEWISDQKEVAGTLKKNEHRVAAKINIEKAEYYLSRFKKGMAILLDKSEKYKEIQTAFRKMNHAILNQHLRFKQPTLNWDEQTGELENVGNSIDLSNDATWPIDYTVQWYPYQIVFIVMNVVAIIDPFSEERITTDCLWFPTGGGKTEAYLGLIGLSILFSRLTGINRGGVVVLMRYTLRLLTAQQFQRAACLITALEHIRRMNPSDYGEIPISIGLYVGSTFSPNTRRDALANFNDLFNRSKKVKNNLTLLKCPWCGAQMGPVNSRGYTTLKGYRKGYVPGTRKNTIKYICDNNLCEFSESDGLPIFVIDEDIYESHPTMLIGTVDKFATLPWKEEAIKMLAPDDDIGKPSLIIQDELHLITGPLGSMVGLYETLVNEICAIEVDGKKAYPKIITSTATVNNATHQINALYNHGNFEKDQFKSDYIKQFPSPGLEYNDSFFGEEIEDENKSRMFIGIHASAYPSPITTQIRVVSALTQSIKTIKNTSDTEVDPYWTLVCYYNSLRELGRSATLLGDDIRSYLFKLQQRQNRAHDKSKKRNTPFKILELTSRKVTDIGKTLEELEKKYDSKNERFSYDICLSTNMISVGVDVSRLGEMLVIGQPKTTSEYIQATSRVGRNTPGLVIVLYNPSRSRDKSHYERFKNYHERLYGNVEPVSVTPFSLPVLDRGLHALIIGLYRYLDSGARPGTPPKNEILEKIENIILSRISSVEKADVNQYRELIRKIIKYWDKENHTTWGAMHGAYSNFEEIPLLFPSGKKKPDHLQGVVFGTPTSLRSVDAECRPEILNIDYEELLS